MRPRIGRLRRGELLAAGGAVALIVCLFVLHWFRPPVPSAAGLTGWSALPVIRWLILVTAVAALALAAFQASRPAPALPVTLSVVVTVLALITAVVLVIRLLSTADAIRAGGWVGLACTLGILLGGGWSMRDEDGWVPGPDRPIERVSLRPPT